MPSRNTLIGFSPVVARSTVGSSSPARTVRRVVSNRTFHKQGSGTTAGHRVPEQGCTRAEGFVRSDDHSSGVELEARSGRVPSRTRRTGHGAPYGGPRRTPRTYDRP